MSPTSNLLFILASLTLANALDVELRTVSCDPDLPVTAEIYLDCDGSSRCTFGEPAMVNGTMFYNGVADAEIENNVAYATANLTLFNLNFNLFDMKPIYLCDADAVTGNSAYGGYQYNCPSDGSYNYSVNYTLPSAGSKSYLGSGWTPSGTIQMFSQADSSMLIGSCNLTLTTYVTPTSGQEYQTPAASIVSAAVLGTLLALTLLLFCCCCCTKTKPKMEQNGMRVIRPYRVQGEDSVMHFRRMTEADRMA